MPRLLVFAPCERVLLDQYGNPSLIAVIQELQLPPVPPNLPAGARGLMRWDIFTLWQREPGDEGREFVQECRLMGPDNSTMFQAATTFDLQKPTHRNIVSVYGFPLGAPGQYLLTLALRDKDAQDSLNVAAFPLTVTREVKAVP